MIPDPSNSNLLERIRRQVAPAMPLATNRPARLSPLPGIRAVLFDVYGTLLISGSGDIGSAQATDNAGALDEALRAAGCVPRTPEAATEGVRLFFQAVEADHRRRRADGFPHPEIDVRETWRTVLASLERTGAVDVPSGDCVPVLAVEYEVRANPVAPMPGFPGVLDELVGKGLVLGIVSNAQFYTPLTMEAITGRSPDALGCLPAHCAWSYRHRIAKPDPALFDPVVQSLSQCGIRADQTVYVGNDMLNDVFAASQRGLRTVLFAGDRRSLRERTDDPRCRDRSPDAVVTELAQLPDLVVAV